jgi:hypothetical protein
VPATVERLGRLNECLALRPASFECPVRNSPAVTKRAQSPTSRTLCGLPTLQVCQSCQEVKRVQIQGLEMRIYTSQGAERSIQHRRQRK